jgi:hypothetical protein
VATQKQRRKRAKEKRHQYDLVEIDADGNETVLSASEVRSETPENGSSAAGKGGRSTSGKGRRKGSAQPPSWPKVLKRGALFAPIFLATVMLLSGGRLTLVGALIQTLFLLAVFVPFSYFMDRLMWRSQQKRLARDRGG